MGLGDLAFLLPELNPRACSFSPLFLFSGNSPWFIGSATCAQPLHTTELRGHLPDRPGPTDGGSCRSSWQRFAALTGCSMEPLMLLSRVKTLRGITFCSCCLVVQA